MVNRVINRFNRNKVIRKRKLIGKYFGNLYNFKSIITQDLFDEMKRLAQGQKANDP